MCILNLRSAVIWHDFEQMKQSGRGKERLRDMSKQLVGGVASLVAKTKDGGNGKGKKQRTRSVGHSLSSIGEVKGGASANRSFHVSPFGSAAPSPLNSRPGSMEIVRRVGSAESEQITGSSLSPPAPMHRDARRSAERDKAAFTKAARKRTQSFDSISSFFGKPPK